MSNHNNQARSGPTSSRTKIKGVGATYRASVQKEGRGGKSSTTPAGKGKSYKMQGQGSAPSGGAVEQKNVSGFGDGHYKPNQG